MYTDPSVDYKLTQALGDAYMQVIENRNANAAKLRAQRGGGTPGTTNLTNAMKASLKPAQATTGAAMKGLAGLASGGSKATSSGGQGNKMRNMGSTPKPTPTSSSTASTPSTSSAPKPTPAASSPASSPAPKPTPTSTPKPSVSSSAQSIGSAAAKTPVKSSEFKTKVTDMPTARMNKALSGIGKWSEEMEYAYEEWLEEKGGLHAWFSKSKSKDGKAGWVQSDGSTCARKPGQTSAPKCYSSQRLAALKKSDKGKKLIRSADARKKSEDSGQSSKSGASKPTYVSTFKDSKDKKKYKSGDQTLKDESFDPTLQHEELNMEQWEQAYERWQEALDEGKKDACYHKVKSRYDVWPSAYASGALVKCRSKGAANWGNSSKKKD